MAEIGFYLLNENKYPGRKLSLFLRWTVVPGDRLQMSLGSNLKVLPANWDKGRHKVKSSDPDHQLINMLLDRIRAELRREYLSLMAAGRTPTSGKMRDVVDRVMGRTKRDSERHTLLTFAELLAEQVKKEGGTDTKRINLASQLNKFCKNYKRSVYFEDLDYQFWKAFEGFLIKQGLSNYYITRLLKTLQNTVKQAASSKYNLTTYIDVLNYSPSIEGKISTKIFLTLEEVLQLHQYEPENDGLQRVKDCFVFACLSGLRFRDWAKVDTSNLSSVTVRSIDYLELPITAKKERQVFIPMFRPSIEILERYGGKLPVISAQKTNAYIKEVARLAGLTSEVNFRQSKGGQTEVSKVQKWEKLSSHDARRTMSHLLNMEGLQEQYINIICGWKGQGSMAKYYDHSEFEQIASREDFYTPVKSLARKLEPQRMDMLFF